MLYTSSLVIKSIIWYMSEHKTHWRTWRILQPQPYKLSIEWTLVQGVILQVCETLPASQRHIKKTALKLQMWHVCILFLNTVYGSGWLILTIVSVILWSTPGLHCLAEKDLLFFHSQNKLALRSKSRLSGVLQWIRPYQSSQLPGYRLFRSSLQCKMSIKAKSNQMQFTN